jgi:putative DNA primase/helicase
MPLIKLVQEAFGYSLTADTSHRVSFWLVGASGTGKSTLLNVLTALAGDSYTTIDLDQIGQNEYQLADVVGKRLVTFTEPSTGAVLNDGAYKRLVSQDVTRARLPYGEPFNFVPICKVWGAMNATPRVVDRSDAVFNRVYIIPMNTIIPDEHRDPYLIDKLKAELPGIFNWALRGLERLRQNGKFTHCGQVERARKEFRAENDTEQAFIEDWFDRDPTGQVKARELYIAYKDWCQHNGYRPKSERSVAKDWQRLGLKKHKNSSVYYIGIRWKPEEER